MSINEFNGSGFIVSNNWSVETFIESTKRNDGYNISAAFLMIADAQLLDYFERITGIKKNKHVGLSSGVARLSSGDISSFHTSLWLGHECIPIGVYWQSKSGRIYKTDDTDIDANDIKFWLDPLDPLMAHQLFYPKINLPFKLKNLSYELIVTRLNLNSTLSLTILEDKMGLIDSIQTDLKNFLEKWNRTQELKDAETFEGVVHSWKTTVNGHVIELTIDMGSTGLVFLKKLLQFFSKQGVYRSVEVS